MTELEKQLVPVLTKDLLDRLKDKANVRLLLNDDDGDEIVNAAPMLKEAYAEQLKEIDRISIKASTAAIATILMELKDNGFEVNDDDQ